MDDRLLIVGAGLAGMTAALAAVEGEAWSSDRVLLVDKGRSPGGRLATRRLGRAHLDHGAQFFTVRSDDFRSAVDRWVAEGIVDTWCHGCGTEDGHPRFRAVGGMRELARHLEKRLGSLGVEIVTRERATALIPGRGGWTATYERAERQPDDATAVILTPPIPQSAEILAAGPVALKPHERRIVDDATDRVVGAHMRGPDAGEIPQGLGIAIQCGATKAQFDATVGIHPTAAEEIVTMRTKAPDPADVDALAED